MRPTSLAPAKLMQRNYRPLSAIAFTVILQGTWEVLMTCVCPPASSCIQLADFLPEQPPKALSTAAWPASSGPMCGPFLASVSSWPRWPRWPPCKSILPFSHDWPGLITRRAPTSGGQYHWVSEFAPAKYQRFLSYFTGDFNATACSYAGF